MGETKPVIGRRLHPITRIIEDQDAGVDAAAF
jgi:hypothetical protein